MPRETIAEQTYQRINSLMSGGLSMAEAVRQIAAEDGKKENAVRGNYYNHRRKVEGANGSPPAPARRASGPRTPEQAIQEARQLLQDALARVDQELHEAKRAVDDAQARYDELATVASERKADLERRIGALS